MPTTIHEIVKKISEIQEIVTFCGGCNPRLFKSIVPEEDNNLFLLIQKGKKLNHTRLLKRALEELLPCPIYVTEESELKETVKAQILANAIPLSDKDNLIKIFDKIDFGEKLALSEQEKNSQAYEKKFISE